MIQYPTPRLVHVQSREESLESILLSTTEDKESLLKTNTSEDLWGLWGGTFEGIFYCKISGTHVFYLRVVMDFIITVRRNTTRPSEVEVGRRTCQFFFPVFLSLIGYQIVTEWRPQFSLMFPLIPTPNLQSICVQKHSWSTFDRQSGNKLFIMNR